MSFIVPPGGFAGFSQMTPASKGALFRPSRTSPRRRRRSKGTARKASARARKSTGRKMKFGSPAWQKKYKVGKFRKK